MMNRTARTLLIATIAALALAGCGTSDHSPSAVKQTVRKYVQAIADGRYGDACGLLTAQAQAQAGGGTADQCPARLALARQLTGTRKFAAAAARADELRVRVDGDRATAKGNGTPVPLVYRGGRWLIGKG